MGWLRLRRGISVARVHEAVLVRLGHPPGDTALLDARARSAGVWQAVTAAASAAAWNHVWRRDVGVLVRSGGRAEIAEQAGVTRTRERL